MKYELKLQLSSCFLNLYAIKVTQENLRVNIKTYNDKTILLSKSYEVNVRLNSEDEIVSKILGIMSNFLIKNCDVSKINLISSSFVNNLDGVVLSINNDAALRNAGVLRENANAVTPPKEASLLSITQRALDKPSSQIDFTELNRSIMQVLDSSRNFNNSTSNQDPDTETRFEVFARLLGLFGGQSTEVITADQSVELNNVPLSRIIFKMAHDPLDPERKNIKTLKIQIEKLLTLMRQKQLEQAKEIAFIKTKTRSGLLPFYMITNQSPQTVNITETNQVTETNVSPDSLVTRAVLQEGYDAENSAFKIGGNEIDSEYLDADIFHLRKELLNFENAYQNIPDDDIVKSDIGPIFISMSRSAANRIEAALHQKRELRRKLTQHRLAREVENILLNGSSGIGVGLKYVACSFKTMLNDSIIKYQCSECSNWTGGSSKQSSSTNCLIGYSDNGAPKTATSFCGDRDVPLGGSAPLGIKYSMNDEISNKVLDEINAILSEV